MKVLLGQINTTPRDWENNLVQHYAGIQKGVDDGARLIVFPELSLPGYLSRDFVYSDNYIKKNLEHLHKIVDFSLSARSFKFTGVDKPTIIVGYHDFNRKGCGKPFRNMVAAIQDGVIIATYQKHLLPFYDVFDEGRYFEPGTELTVIDIDGIKWGLTICEDIWNDKGQDDYNYIDNPLSRYREIGVNHIITANSSPYVVGKPAARRLMLSSSTKDGGCIIYCNQKGGQDELIFDGHSAIAHHGDIVFQSVTPYSSEPDFLSFNILHDSGDYGVIENKGNYTDQNQSSTLVNMLVLGLRDYIHKSGFEEIVVGSSGGIDSAVVLALAAMAIGPTNVHGIRMPGPFSSPGSSIDALRLHENIGCWDYVIPIDIDLDIKVFNEGMTTVRLAGAKEQDKFLSENLSFLTDKQGRRNPVAQENLQARKRGEIIMRFSNAYGALPLTTGNKTELAVGYCTLYGDMNGGFAPINDQLKMDVYEIARAINKLSGKEVIPDAIINKAPSAELAPGQTDEASLLPYPILDLIVDANITCHINDLNSFGRHITKLSALIHSPSFAWQLANAKTWADDSKSQADYDRIIRLIDNSEYKRRQAAPGLKTSRIAFGTGRRLPIVKGPNNFDFITKKFRLSL